MDQFLGGGFAIAAGDGDERDVELAAMMEGKLLQGCEDVGDADKAVGPAGSREIESTRFGSRGVGGRAGNELVRAGNEWVRVCTGILVGVLVDDAIGGALLEGFDGEGIAVEVGAFEGEEKVAVLQLPRIRPDRWRARPRPRTASIAVPRYRSRAPRRR